jgi:hypothetical protein
MCAPEKHRRCGFAVQMPHANYSLQVFANYSLQVFANHSLHVFANYSLLVSFYRGLYSYIYFFKGFLGLLEFDWRLAHTHTHTHTHTRGQGNPKPLVLS